jgi:PiT family inorganic phosphate transporter
VVALAIGIIVLALVFDFYNGMNDAANSIATVVSTRVLTPRQAVAWAAFWNFVAAFVLGTAVAKTIFNVVDPEVSSEMMVLSLLLGAIVWTHVCTVAGLPISVSHALIGGMIGAAMAKTGFDLSVLNVAKIENILLFIVLAPLIGMVVGYVMMLATYLLLWNQTPHRVDRVFRWGQLLSSAGFSLGHGGNDAQKTMAIITLTLAAAFPSYQADGEVKIWVILSAHAAIALGTLMGGWAVIQTMGAKLTKLRPVQGFCAETSGALVLLWTTLVGTPVSTTHSITGSILGVGVVRRFKAVRWGIATRILWAWVLTIPASAAVSGGVYWLFDVTGLVALAER